MSMEKLPKNSETRPGSKVVSVETARGSVYRYLPDDTTQRFKKAEGREYGPQSALVYVPDYEWVAQHTQKDILNKLGENEIDYMQTLLGYVQGKGKKVYIINTSGKKLETNQEVREAQGLVYLCFLTGDVVDFTIPVSSEPRIGFSTFDTRKYKDESTGEMVRESHLGNKVVKINAESLDTTANEAVGRGA